LLLLRRLLLLLPHALLDTWPDNPSFWSAVRARIWLGCAWLLLINDVGHVCTAFSHAYATVVFLLLLLLLVHLLCCSATGWCCHRQHPQGHGGSCC
jgi:hypothetical protein